MGDDILPCIRHVLSYLRHVTVLLYAPEYSFTLVLNLPSSNDTSVQGLLPQCVRTGCPGLPFEDQNQSTLFSIALGESVSEITPKILFPFRHVSHIKSWSIKLSKTVLNPISSTKVNGPRTGVLLVHVPFITESHTLNLFLHRSRCLNSSQPDL